ncbi:MAG TPA: hypothetical protein VGK58_11325 [Lacipirellulaceae bacterium]
MPEPCAKPEPASSWRWFRFSLRTFLIGVTLISLGFFFFNRVQNERRAARAIAEAHGHIVYDWQILPPGATPKTPPPKPPGPQWVRKRLGPHWFDRIVEVRLNESTNKSDKNRFAVVAPHLAKLSSLRSLTQSGETFDSNDYRLLSQLIQLESLRVRQENELLPQHAAAIARLTGLHDLSLSDIKTSPEALRELAKSPHLEKLQITCFYHGPIAGGLQTKYQLRDDAAEALAAFPMLKSLELYLTRITDEGMEKLCRLSKLERLTVGSPHITSASFDHIRKLKRLTALGTWAWKIDDDDLQKLSQMPQLTTLDLLTHLSDKSVPHVTALGQIERLRLRGEGVTDASVPHLLRLTKLQWLHLSGTSINKLGPAAKQLKRAFPKCAILLPKTEKEKEAERAFNNWRFGGGNL